LNESCASKVNKVLNNFFYQVLMIVYYTKDYRVYEFCPSPHAVKEDISEDGPVSIFR
jgi:hypothetical protein